MLDPIAPGRWDYSTAAHLLNRAGFGGTPAEIEALVALGAAGAVDHLLDYRKIQEPLDAPEWAKPDPERAAKLRNFREATEAERKELFRKDQEEQRRRILELRSWWLNRMVTTRRPLEEKLVLFWHGHFATSIQKVRDPWLMYRQLATFRELATGNWPALLLAITRDPAMLIWLDQAQSRREHPNENYAREVMELFALGEGHYTEKDIQETARALTGLTFDRLSQEPAFIPRRHDFGTKTVLGRTGNLGPEEVIQQIAESPQSSRFLPARLWRFFAQDPAPPAVVEALSAEFRSAKLELRPVLRRMFLAGEFYAPEAVRTQIKSPVQWLVGSLRQLERPLPRLQVVNNALRELGQELLAPPNVKGWDGGTSWINTGTLTRRQQYAALLVKGREAVPDMVAGERGERLRQRMQAGRGTAAPVSGVNPERLFSETERADRAHFTAALERRFLQSRFRPQLAADVATVLGDDRVPDSRAMTEAMRVVVQSTDYQLT